MWDLFISHATEDKGEIAAPLAEALSAAGLKVWYDDFTLTLGDSLNRSINQGLAQARYGIVILSPAFLAKEWPQRELDGLTTREVSSGKVILPVWHKLERSEVELYSPILADKLGISTERGLDVVVAEILRVLHERPQESSVTHSPKPNLRVRWLRPLLIGLLLTALGGAFGYRLYQAQQPRLAREKISAWPLVYDAENFVQLAREGNFKAVKLFLTAGIDPNVSAPANSWGDEKTAMMVAAGAGETAVVQALLEAGADVNRWVDGDTALEYAAYNGHLGLVHLMLDHGADQKAKDAAVYQAASGGHAEILRLLLQSGASMSDETAARCLNSAAYIGNLGVVRLLLERGVGVNTPDPSGDHNPPVIEAARNESSLPLLKFLLDRGTDINGRNAKGETALMWADTVGVSLLLIERGADVNAKDSGGCPYYPRSWKGMMRMPNGRYSCCWIMARM